MPRCGRKGTTSAETSACGDDCHCSRRRPATCSDGRDDGKAAVLAQRAPECDEVVEGFFDGIADQIVHRVADLAQRSVGGQAVVGVVAVGDPAQPVDDARQLVLLGHVIQQVPTQIAAVVVGWRGGGEAEYACLDAYHAAPPAGECSSASACRFSR